ncbi:hypothetical protein F441_04528 [Phytophthora nicotianae CJ01A1]|uniref:RxLR effector protein n=6 Tax=Phytophthora nicotianae TaxID=4792 RepID=W2QJV8_PHYN3|nr:hypothetical protein PPTG_22420 [Phytophthora nicotianae INRA-310]ETI52266.1 hypothetical protein F443_04553 [Phytophthora nicotianae P1569]ETK92161.1 hypothetical protein L915_04426 [Phytophthora nicotianae]ETO81028.1 hypothetical protein F444_04583 [Phytophthora nicotianae P1976]ETP22092.1 hypothetical protein F441_04528 [Phytophthora nicotianae CJ01A1]ETP49990.1 hypothetical protein F442_04598 [Phytophthora nicotianae P10297]
MNASPPCLQATRWIFSLLAAAAGRADPKSEPETKPKPSDAKEEAVSRRHEEIRCRELIRLSGAATGSLGRLRLKRGKNAGSAPRWTTISSSSPAQHYEDEQLQAERP